jgi:uncharacterized DUF497 family protein
MYNQAMKYEWNPDKNEWLKKERGVSFEKVLYHLSIGDVWRITEHPNQQDYPGQKIYFVIIDDYVYMVPFIVTDTNIFLKTIIPSRKATGLYKEDFGS